MIEIENLVRDNIRNLKPYSSARDEHQGNEGVFLDANENPYGNLNRYPDPYHRMLRQKTGSLKNIDPSRIFIGNGSDEIIDLVFRIFCTPGKDKALTFNPTYGMYEVAAAINDTELIKADLDDSFQINWSKLSPLLSDSALKLVIVCSPNNPTGNTIKDIRFIAENFHGIIMVDEAYIDFSDDGSLLETIDNYPNMIVCQTYSKAYGLAGARIGVAYSSRLIIDYLYRVKPPYNVSVLNQRAAIAALNDNELFTSRKKRILNEKLRLINELQKLSFVERIYPSDANFLLVKFADSGKVFSELLKRKIIVRDRSHVIRDALRITVGTPAENNILLRALRSLDGGVLNSQNNEEDEVQIYSARSSRVSRTTSETSLVVDLSLDGNGIADVSTGIGFFDHMLNQIARHGGFDIGIYASGDLHVDEHHTIEDVALALGEAFDRALGDRKGIERYGFMLPMDDAIASVALDFSGRSFLVWDVSFSRDMIGGMPAEMISHFFRSFSVTARCNLNIKAEGVNEHHKAEAVFKAFARAAGMAAKKNSLNTIPSTKGVL